MEKRFKPTSLVKAVHRTERAENISEDSARVHLKELVKNHLEDKLLLFEVQDGLL